MTGSGPSMIHSTEVKGRNRKMNATKENQEGACETILTSSTIYPPARQVAPRRSRPLHRLDS